jgi:hypothetical protein
MNPRCWRRWLWRCRAPGSAAQRRGLQHKTWRCGSSVLDACSGLRLAPRVLALAALHTNASPVGARSAITACDLLQQSAQTEETGLAQVFCASSAVSGQTACCFQLKNRQQ